jgi:hypothetical protein
MKILLVGFGLIFIVLYLVMLYSLLVVSARSDKTMCQLMEKEWMESNETEYDYKIISEEE